MENMEAYINLLIQVPLVGVFIWFAIKQTQMFLDALENRDIAWRDFLREQRNASNAALGRVAEEIKEASNEISELRGKMG